MSPTRRRPLAGLAALAAAAAVIAGCGDDSSGLSADEFREKANAICADAERQIDGLEEPASAEGLLPFLRSGLEIQSTQLEALKGLEPPSDLEGTYDEAIGLLEQQQARITAAADRIESGEDARSVITAADPEIESLSDQADEKARELGLTACLDDEDETPTATDGTTTATAPTAPSTETAPSTDSTDTSGLGDTGAYVDDVQEAAAALQSFGTLLQSTTGIDDLKAKIPEARTNLDQFDAAIAELDGYTLPTAQLERQRTGLLRTGPDVSDVLRRFLDAAASGDASAVQSLLPEVTQTITEFQQAATAG